MNADPETAVRSQIETKIKDLASAASLVRREGERQVNLERLKNFAIENLSKKSPLKDVLLSETNQLGARDFLAKMDLWLKLLSLERKMD